MLLLDVNICLCAYRPAESESPAVVSKWLGPRLVGHERIAVSEPVLASVIRIATRPNVFRTPSTPSDVVAFTESLASAPAAQRVRRGRELGDRHRPRQGAPPEGQQRAWRGAHGPRPRARRNPGDPRPRYRTLLGTAPGQPARW
jgi:hypothetical protein